ncbi:MAG: hypothetical protein H0X17_25190, partial [Deltaproteobacteria bacterium]|nr:hypothetical protein [Deltaproteobacteria bacterium]
MPPAPRDLARHLVRWPIALVTCLVIGAVVLLPSLGTPGLWEPTERQLADRIAPPQEIAREREAAARKSKL